MAAIVLAVLAAVIGGIVAGAGPCVARDGLLGENRLIKVDTGLRYRAWTLDEDGDELRVSQLAVPVRVRVPLDRQALALTVETSAALSGLERDVRESLGGGSDTDIMASYMLPSERLIVTGGVRLPTGPTDFEGADVRIARAVANQLLGFSTRRYGAGFDTYGHVSAAWPLTDEVSIGGTAKVTVTGEYEFAQSAEEGLNGTIGPSDELALSVGASYRRDIEDLWSEGRSDISLNLDLAARFYGADRLDGDEVFEPGDEVELLATGSLSGTRTRTRFAARGVLKGENALLNDVSDLVLEDALTNLVLTNVTGSWGELGGSVGYRLSPYWDLSGHLRYAYYGRVETAGSANGIASREQAWTLALGPTVGWSPDPVVSLSLGASYLHGSAEAGALSMRGVALSGAATLRF
jgi:hypothetical protein